jgi:predicted GNAT family acetyltransferase
MSAAADITCMQMASNGLVVRPLARSDEGEVIEYLSRRPIHTFGLISFVINNGIISPLNRGVFYGCRDEEGELLGVALIGRVTLFEAETSAAIEAFAAAARERSDTRILLGEKEPMHYFWDCYAQGMRAATWSHYDLFVKQKAPGDAVRPARGIRLATFDDLDLVVTAHAHSGVEENGSNLLREDMAGFVQRCARRLEQSQTWVMIENEKLIFKADVLTYTEQVAYLEAVWVDPDYRGCGLGSRCMSELSLALLERTNAICLLVERRNLAARSVYLKTGFVPLCPYEAIFV